jgi:hypothetical protein
MEYVKPLCAVATDAALSRVSGGIGGRASPEANEVEPDIRVRLRGIL